MSSLRTQLSRSEYKICMALVLLYVIRMLGLFIILPVFSLYQSKLDAATPFLMGLAFSSYAITQMLLQPIFGFISDRYGRKFTIVVGLLLFIVGSVIIAFSTHIYWVLLGRVVQGSGAISAVILAFATDLTRDVIRTKVMAMIGISIGITFGLAMFLGPFLAHWVGMRGIFLLCAVLGGGGIFITVWMLPNPISKELSLNTQLNIGVNAWDSFKHVVVAPDLWRLYLGAMILHLILTMAFMAIPWGLQNAQLMLVDHWKMYVPTFFVSLCVMGGVIRRADQYLKSIFLTAIGCLIFALILLNAVNSVVMIGIALTCFFIGFNVMEAMQPSLMAKYAPPQMRGMAMGIFSSMQFLGASIGGVIGGVVAAYMGLNAIYGCAALVAMMWLMLALGMKAPQIAAMAVKIKI